MIPSQQPMMIDLAKNFERLVKDPKVSRKDFVCFGIDLFRNLFLKNEVEMILV